VKIATPSTKINAMSANVKNGTRGHNALVKRFLGALMTSLSAWGT